LSVWVSIVFSNPGLSPKAESVDEVQAASAAFGVDELGGEQAAPVQVEIRVEVVGIELVDRLGKALRDVGCRK
jgi:hypothetical protein